jgi:hypothetical protein
LVEKQGRVYPLEGEFKVERNSLAFMPAPGSRFEEELRLPRKVRLAGRWKLDEHYNLRLILIETRDQRGGGELKIHGKIIGTEAEELVFQTHCKRGARKSRLSLLRLGGSWQADRFNRLQFLVGGNLEKNILRFQGVWEINRCQQIIYKYRKRDLARGTTRQEQLRFKGHWRINAKNRLTYILDLRKRSFFEFRVQMESPSLWAAKGEIKYRLGIGVKELRKERVLSLFGQWKIGRRGAISFEMDYGGNDIRRISFGARVFLNKNKQLVFELQDSRGKDLGIEVIFKTGMKIKW